MAGDKNSLPGAGLVKGLATTFKNMTQRSVTAQYPDVKPELPPRSRGVIALLEENCTSCMLCARECPDWCIYIDSHKETVPAAEPGQRDRTRNVLDRFAIDYSLCMYCGICIEVCPFDALFWSPEFEYAEFDIVDLLHEKDRLREWMWTVPPPPSHAENAEPAKEIAAALKAQEKQAAVEAKAAAERVAALEAATAEAAVVAEAEAETAELLSVEPVAEAPVEAEAAAAAEESPKAAEPTAAAPIEAEASAEPAEEPTKPVAEAIEVEESPAEPQAEAPIEAEASAEPAEEPTKPVAEAIEVEESPAEPQAEEPTKPKRAPRARKTAPKPAAELEPEAAEPEATEPKPKPTDPEASE